MKRTEFNQLFTKLFTLVTLSFMLFGFTSPSGLDSYEIYLNHKLIMKQSVNQPLNLRVLQLNQAKENDQLRINYKHCSVKEAGRNRSILIKNKKGDVLKKWAFADTEASDLSMVIPVKELLAIEKANAKNELILYYTSQELQKGEMLAFLRM